MSAGSLCGRLAGSVRPAKLAGRGLPRALLDAAAQRRPGREGWGVSLRHCCRRRCRRRCCCCCLSLQLRATTRPQSHRVSLPPTPQLILGVRSGRSGGGSRRAHGGPGLLHAGAFSPCAARPAASQRQLLPVTVRSVPFHRLSPRFCCIGWLRFELQFQWRRAEPPWGWGVCSLACLRWATRRRPRSVG